MSPCFKLLREHHCYTSTWIHPSKPAIKMAIGPWWEQTQWFSHVLLLSASSGVSDPPTTDPLMIRSWELLGPCDSPSKFWCKHMPPNFGTKEILFQNYHVRAPDRPVVTGKEFWSGVYYSSPSISTHEPMLQNFFRALSLHGRLDSLVRANSTIQPCFTSICLLGCFRSR